MAESHRKKIIPVFLEDCELTPGTELQLKGYNVYHSFKLSEAQLLDSLMRDLQSAAIRPSGLPTALPSAAECGPVSETRGEIQVIEALCESKSPDEMQCEDRLVVTDDFIAVIDGATSKNSGSFNGLTGGTLAADFLASYLESGRLSRDSDGRTAVVRMQAALRDYAKQGAFESRGIHLCASAVIYSVFRRQIWSVGDCQFMINGQLHSFPKKVDEIMSQARAMAIQCLLNSGMTEDELLRDDKARELILPELCFQKYLENTKGEFGYSVFSGLGEIREASFFDVGPDSEIVLASDGYPVLCPTLEESERHLQQLIRTDPLCFRKYKSTKGLHAGNRSFDDKTYVRFHVN